MKAIINITKKDGMKLTTLVDLEKTEFISIIIDALLNVDTWKMEIEKE